MRAAALVLLAVAAVWPARQLPARALLGAVAGVLVVRSVWATGLGGQGAWWLTVAVLVLAGLAAWWLPLAAPAPFGWRWLVLAGSAVAAYCCVPETDQFREVALVLLAGAVAEVLRRRPLPTATVTAGWGLVAWAALYGATARPSALVGGTFALVAPVAASLPRVSATTGVAETLGSRRGAAGLAVGVVWVAAGVVVARTGGIATTAKPAHLAAAIGATAALAVSAPVWRRAGRPRRGG